MVRMMRVMPAPLKAPDVQNRKQVKRLAASHAIKSCCTLFLQLGLPFEFQLDLTRVVTGKPAVAIDEENALGLRAPGKLDADIRLERHHGLVNFIGLNHDGKRKLPRLPRVSDALHKLLQSNTGLMERRSTANLLQDIH